MRAAACAAAAQGLLPRAPLPMRDGWRASVKAFAGVGATSCHCARPEGCERRACNTLLSHGLCPDTQDLMLPAWPAARRFARLCPACPTTPWAPTSPCGTSKSCFPSVWTIWGAGAGFFHCPCSWHRLLAAEATEPPNATASWIATLSKAQQPERTAWLPSPTIPRRVPPTSTCFRGHPAARDLAVTARLPLGTAEECRLTSNP